MKDHERIIKNMNNASLRRRGHYDKDMDHAFTLIFHNIKRLQDGHLCNSDPNLVVTDAGKRNVREKPDETPKVPRRKRSRSETCLQFVRDETPNQSVGSNAEGSSLQRRKVRFADDCEHPMKLPLSRTVSEPHTLYSSSKSAGDGYRLITMDSPVLHSRKNIAQDPRNMPRQKANQLC